MLLHCHHKAPHFSLEIANIVCMQCHSHYLIVLPTCYLTAFQQTNPVCAHTYTPQPRYVIYLLLPGAKTGVGLSPEVLSIPVSCDSLGTSLSLRKHLAGVQGYVGECQKVNARREMFSINGRGLTCQSGRFSHHVNGAESFRFCQL